ncbi:hypothetical protein HOG48_04840 [Candidatus Peregrinibacteria bacterium]|nr:hypothetical protein [Candidatus Peregrinibacteria bacterium]
MFKKIKLQIENPFTSLIIFFLTGLLIYGISLNGEFIWDDLGAVVNNEHVTSFKFIKQWFTEGFMSGAGVTSSNLYRPLATGAYAAIFGIFGLKAIGYHLISLFIHVLNTFLAFNIFKRLRFHALGSFFAAMIFLVHPVQTEAVAHIAGLPDILGATAILLGVFVFLSNLKTIPSTILLALIFIAGLLTKESSITLALLIPLLAFFNWKNYSAEEKARAKTLIGGTLGIAILYTLSRFTILNFHKNLDLHLVENEYTKSLPLRIITFISVIWEYFRLTFFPVSLHFERAFMIYPNLASPWGVFGLITLLTCGGFSYKSFRGNKYFLLGTLWFFIALLPVTGLIPVNATYAERWLYIPIIGVLLLIPAIYEICRTVKSKKIFTGILILILILFGARSIYRNMQWADSLKFYENELKYNESSARLFNQTAQSYFEIGDHDMAIQYFEKGVAADVNRMYPEINYNLANTYFITGNVPAAINQYMHTLSKSPNLIRAHVAMQGVSKEIGNTNMEQSFSAFVERIENGEQINFKKEILPLVETAGASTQRTN